MARWNLAWLAAVPALVVAGLVVVATAPEPDADYKLVRTVVDVLAEVDKSYVRELSPADKRKLVEAMITGGLEKLDPHSQYLSADEYGEFTTQADGKFGGVGLRLALDPVTRGVVVESPMAGGPALAAGVWAGDALVKVDGTSTAGLTVEDVRAAVKGEPGTTVVLTVRRAGTPDREVGVRRAVIEVAPVKGVARTAADPLKWDWFADPARQVAFVRLTSFSEKSDKAVRDAVAEAEQQGARALILDLRDNPGGLLTQAAAVADLFLTAGPIVSTATRRGGDGAAIPTRSLTAKADGTIFEPAADKPVAVLVNRMSASAAEIVAAALQDNKRAVVVGERSYGKGSVQKVFPLSAGAAVKLTTEIWLTPAGKNIHRWPDSKDADEWGVRPDAGLEVKLTDAQRADYVRHDRDADIIRPPTAPPAPPRPADPVVDKAVEALKAKLTPAAGRPA